VYQRQKDLKGIIAPGPGLFYSKELFDSINGFDESYPFFEEWPFCTRVLASGNRIFLIDKYLLQYRVHSNSLSHGEFGLYERVFRDCKKYVYQEKLIKLILHGNILYAWHIHLNYLFLTIRYHFDKDSFAFKYAKYILLFSPLLYIFKIRSIIRNILNKQ
jgi:hypothetical protein